MIDFYEDIPKQYKANLAHRDKWGGQAELDAGVRRYLMAACAEDVVFFFAHFCWLYEPRPRRDRKGRVLPKMIPFIPWEHQVPAIREIKQNLGFSDIGVEKSRGEGMSWIAVLLALHSWIFEDQVTIGLVSRTEPMVDDPSNPDSLFWKLDWEISKLPSWMVGVPSKNRDDGDWYRSLTDHALVNNRNKSTITGYSAVGDVASGGRKTWFLMDELSKFPRPADHEAMASTQQVTESRLIISTPKGSSGAYFDVMHEPSNMVKVIIDWKDNPSRNRGLYRMHEGLPVAVDPINNPLPISYAPPSKETLDLFSRLRRKGFNLEKGLRSPWYDRECDRPKATPQNIAQELDRDYGGSMYRVFMDDFVKAAEETVKPPYLRGSFSVNDTLEEWDFDRGEDGQFHLWCSLDSSKQPPRHQYVVAADLSTGVGGTHTSNSVLEIIDLNTREQVGEFATNIILPADFADIAIGVCKWFHGAFLAWELNGPGGGFWKRVKRRGYADLFKREVGWKSTSTKKSKDVGWWSDDTTKPIMFSEFGSSVKEADLIIRSRALVEECKQYVWVNGKITHVATASASDDSVGAQHGDRVIAIGVGVQAMKDRPLPKNEPSAAWGDGPPPYGTLAHREWLHEQSKNADRDDWDERSTSDLHSRRPLIGAA